MKSKGSSSGDRLSELPDSLIFEIFWYLLIEDVVRTSNLSKRWRNLWTTAPSLNFSIDDNRRRYSFFIFLKRRRGDSLDSVRDLMNRAIILWRGDKLLKFKVSFKDELNKTLLSDVNVWIRFAKEKQVQELCLDLPYLGRRSPWPYDRYKTEFESLYSCSSLRVLSIDCQTFFIGRDGNGNVKWDRLKSLTINGCWKWDQSVMNKVMCGCPELEVFILSQVEMGGDENPCIQSSSLKKLSIHMFPYPDSDEYLIYSELKIRTPNLETLEISGVPHGKLSVDVPSLTDVTLRLYCLHHRSDRGELCESIELQETLKQILPSIQHVQRVTLSGCCIEMLGVMNKRSLLSPLSNVKFLKLKGSESMLIFSKQEIVGLLEVFPNLKRLVIEDNYEDEAFPEDENEYDCQDDREPLEFDAKLPYSSLLQLRTVEVTWAKSDESIFLVIETLLKYASKLEKMVFRVKGFKPASPPTYPLFFASQKLLRMPRSSPTAQLIFCKY